MTCCTRCGVAGSLLRLWWRIYSTTLHSEIPGIIWFSRAYTHSALIRFKFPFLLGVDHVIRPLSHLNLRELCAFWERNLHPDDDSPETKLFPEKA